MNTDQHGQQRRVAFITGASSGIGLATATTLAGQGWNLVLVARAGDPLAKVRAECERCGAQALIALADVGEQDQVDAAVAAASDHFGRIDAVINSAAAVGYGRFEDVPAEIFDRVIVTNLLGTANVARAALRHFRAAPATGNDRHLVLMGSLLGKIAVPFMSPYVTSKWGVHALTRMLQLEARDIPGVRVSLISPGSVNTPAYTQAANYAGWEGRPPPPVDPPEKVAKAIVRTLSAPRRERSVGIANHVVVFGFRAFPAVFDVLVTPLMRLGGLSRRKVPAHSGTVLGPRPNGDAPYGGWNRFGRRMDPATGEPVQPESGSRTGTPPPLVRSS